MDGERGPIRIHPLNRHPSNVLSKPAQNILQHVFFQAHLVFTSEFSAS